MDNRKSIRPVAVPQASCRAGAARRDITPPVGIYHRMWGAALHDRATGVHRPLTATALVLESAGGASPTREVIVGIDHCLMWADDMGQLLAQVCQKSGIAEEELHIAFTHTHAAGLMDRSRSGLPGGELIGPYLDRLAELIADAIVEAVDKLEPASVVYGQGRSDLAAHRDLWDPVSQQFVCGFNPAGPADDTIQLARIDDNCGKTLAVVVNYACHPTTLAWDNTQISPDYVGALRETVEESQGGLCLFLQGASGDLGPREGYVGDPKIADRNGRQLGYAVLSALESLPQGGLHFEYAGPVVSGATIGVWQYAPAAAAAERRHGSFRSCRWSVRLPYVSNLPTREQSQADLTQWLKALKAAEQAHDALAIRDCRAQVERVHRQAERLAQLPPGAFELPIALWQLGDAYWLMLEGEYYQVLQRALRARLQQTPLIVATVVNGWRPAYVCPRETYGRGIYQEQVAVLAPGCLETVIESIAAKIANSQGDPAEQSHAAVVKIEQ